MGSGLDSKKWLDALERLIFDMLLVTDGRTTDLLEAILDEKMLVSVSRQHKLAPNSQDLPGGSSSTPYYLRESILISDKSRFITSHNIALVHSQYVPKALFERIAIQEEGIGAAIRSIGIELFRQVVDSGFKIGDEAVDLFGQPLPLRFPNLKRPIPYKKYWLCFGRVPGIQMLEYFNPEMVNHRLKRI